MPTPNDAPSPRGRPPKPVPFGYEYAPSGSHPSDAKIDSHSSMRPTRGLSSSGSQGREDSIDHKTRVLDSFSSNDSRRSLRADVQKRRGSLSQREIEFLDQLCVYGKETEVQVARQRLLDETLFPELEDDVQEVIHSSLGLSLSEPSSSGVIQYGGERSLTLVDAEMPNMETPTMEPPFQDRPDFAGMEASQRASSSTLGSEKRLTSLETRRKSAVFEHLWKSHQNGLSLSNSASRRNLLERQGSSMRRASLSSVKDDAIFRSRRNSLSSRKSPMMIDTQSESTRRRSRRLSFRRSQTVSIGERRASTSNVTGGRIKPVLRRQQSDFSHKSVTFGDLPQRREEVEEDLDASFLSFIKRTPPRSDSMSSFPSLHQAHRIHSASSMRSLSSIPSIHLANHVFSKSQSFRSSVSAGPDWDWNLDSIDSGKCGEEKKVDELPEDMDIAESKDTKELRPLNKVSSIDFSRPVLVSSARGLEEEGMEVADFELFALSDRDRSHHGLISLDSARRLESLVSFGGGAESVLTSASFDETMSHGRISAIFRRSNLTRTLSDDDLTGIYLGGSRLYLRESSSMKEVQPEDDDLSWIGSEVDEFDYYDAWNVIKDEYPNGYGGGGTLPFLILGTFPEDVDSQPHVLSPPLMESLHEFVPIGLTGQNFWMKYSLVRDGASLFALLKAARGAKYSILAIETVDGEVFGCFTSQAWRKNWNYYGGTESFLWRMQHTRKEKTRSIIEQAQIESEIEVYPYTGANDHIQLCTHDKIAVGGRSETAPFGGSDHRLSSLRHIKEHEWGFGLTIEKDCLTGTSSPCMTFSSPSLSREHADGSIFEIMNMELWTLTPCMTVEDAEKLELGKLFLEEHTPRH